MIPDKRPSCDQLLSQPAILSRINNRLLVEIDPNLERKNELMKTINQKDFKKLKNTILPKANYQKLQTVIINREDFLGHIRSHSTNKTYSSNNNTLKKQIMYVKIKKD